MSDKALTVAAAVKRWSEAASACEHRGQVVRDGNWEPIARVLRHFTSEAAASVELVGTLGGVSILKITPVQPTGEPPAGKTWNKRLAFLLLVK